MREVPGSTPGQALLAVIFNTEFFFSEILNSEYNAFCGLLSQPYEGDARTINHVASICTLKRYLKNTFKLILLKLPLNLLQIRVQPPPLNLTKPIKPQHAANEQLLVRSSLNCPMSETPYLYPH